MAAERQPHHRAEQIDVVDCIELRIPADAKLENRRNAGANIDIAGIDAVNAAEHLQQRALAAAVAPHDAECLAGVQFEADALERLKSIERLPFEQSEDVLADRVAPHARNLKRLRHIR